MVKLYDLRMMRTLAPMSFPAGPTLLKFHSKLPSTVIVGAQSGQFQICDINSLDYINVHFHQANVTGYLTSMDISSTGQFLSFGDSMGTVLLWAEAEQPRINA